MKSLTYIIFLLVLTSLSQAAPQSQAMAEDPQHIQRWNNFFSSLLELHQQYLKSHDVETTESIGGYANHPNFYRDVYYYDKKTKRLLSHIQWEQQHSNQAHLIEVFIYDEHGRLDRDYLAAYLPESRNAPIQTLINLHQYSDDLHSYRQFDASGNRIYEHCERGAKNQHILIQLDDDDITLYHRGLAANVNRKIYQSCFNGLEETALNYLQPF